ncbi:zf-HC2 domain-containing protein [Paenibacillus sp. YPG26]|uniref:anti-sigma factor family protein n=1 Tax=Paenibacillus sp. YPG26 TaxID=2878915 RepID=UPI00203B692F|nr:zf-HC2 domain-containing protein [Paenibacillus sp. YPG26]USB34782.1 zf-HC2 domain-containing protein [Paenibacillus sp. YPG26]
MNCREAQESFGLIWDVAADDPRRKNLEWHVLGCEDCAAEYEIWKETQDIIHNLQIDIQPGQAERVNRAVMDRIYAESPWLAPGGPESRKTSQLLRRRMALWIAGFLTIFICSLLYFMIPTTSEVQPPTGNHSGLLPVAIAGTDTVMNTDHVYDMPDVSRGIIDPLIVKMSPAYPQYWMLLSMLALGLGLFSWRGLRHIRR